MGPEILYFPIILCVLYSFIRTGLGASNMNMRHRLGNPEFPEEAAARREVVDTTVTKGCLDSEGISRVPTVTRINFSLMLGYHRQDGKQFSQAPESCLAF